MESKNESQAGKRMISTENDADFVKKVKLTAATTGQGDANVDVGSKSLLRADVDDSSSNFFLNFILSIY